MRLTALPRLARHGFSKQWTGELAPSPGANRFAGPDHMLFRPDIPSDLEDACMPVHSNPLAGKPVLTR